MAKNRSVNVSENILIYGASLGAAVGAVLGTLFENISIPLGISLGIAFGVAAAIIFGNKFVQLFGNMDKIEEEE